MLNRVILIGRLATAPESKYTPSGIAVTTFRLAVDRPLSAEARASGQDKQADFIDISTWRQNAETASKHLNKGQLIAVEGRLQIREYETQDGQRRKAAEVIVDNFKILDWPKNREGGEGGGYEEQDDQRGGGYDQKSSGGGYDRAERSGGYDQRSSGGGYDRPAAGGAARAPQAAPPARRSAPPADNYNYDDDIADPFAE